jgi:protein-S-isoprenylcysteine O-methyltransferase Ste14
MKLNVITLVVIVAFVVWLVLHAGSVEWTAVKVVGAVIAGVSVALLVVARLQLGASFSVSAQARKLVTTGLYAKIRNPIYVFAGLFLVGLVMVTGRWALLALLGILVPMQIVRARKEEQVLAEAFGKEYVRYKAGTWF